MVVRPFCGSTHSPVATAVVLAAAHTSASVLVLKPRFVRLLPSEERYCTRQAWPLAVGYFLIDAILDGLSGVPPWAAWPLVVPAFDFLGVPKGGSFVEACYYGWGAAVGVVVRPGVAGDATVGGAVDGAP